MYTDVIGALCACSGLSPEKPESQFHVSRDGPAGGGVKLGVGLSVNTWSAATAEASHPCVSVCRRAHRHSSAAVRTPEGTAAPSRGKQPSNMASWCRRSPGPESVPLSIPVPWLAFAALPCPPNSIFR